MIETIVYDTKQKSIIRTEGTPPKAALLENKDLMIWINLNHFSDNEIEQVLVNLFNFHPITIEDCLTYSNMPKIQEYENYTFIVLHAPKYLAGVRHDDDGDKIQAREIDFYIGTNFLVTVHRKNILSIPEIANLCDKNPSGTIGKGIDNLLYLLIDQMVDNYQPTIDKIDNEIEKYEDDVFNNASQDFLSNLLRIKHEILYLRRIFTPQREVMNKIARGECRQISKKIQIYFRDISDKMYRMIDLVENYREILTGIQETFLSIASNNMNKIMLLLTVIATAILVPTLITGFYGMNVLGLPFAESKYSSLFVLIIMILTSAVIVLFFKKKKWF